MKKSLKRIIENHRQETSLPNEQNNTLHEVVDIIPAKTLQTRNKERSWEYGYNKEWNIIIISRDGTLGEIYKIQGLMVGLPSVPKKVYKRDSKKKEQYWEPFELPRPLKRIKDIFKWDEMDAPFKDKWEPYIDEEFNRRESGFWFMNNGEPTYITGAHYFYLNWAKIDVGLADYRYANRIQHIFWEACKADKRSFGMVYLKIRRSGASYMGASECVNVGTLSKESRIGILSKTGTDAKKMFIGKVVPMNFHLPFFFKPIMSGSEKPKTVLEYSVPATRITRKSLGTKEDEELEGLDTSIDWKNTENNAYDGEKMKLLIMDETGKWLRPNDLEQAWRVHKTCAVLGSKIIGKVWMCSTCNALDQGGQEFKDLYGDSNVLERNNNGRTKSGLYALFIPARFNTEGFIDRYGFPVIETPEEPVMGVDGEYIEQGFNDWWQGEVEGLKSKPDSLNEFYRQFPETEAHAFRDDSKNSLFNLEAIYDHIDLNDATGIKDVIIRGNFGWKDGKRDTEVIFYPDNRGRFLINWIPPKHLQNRHEIRNGTKYPANSHIGAFGCDSYDISGTVDGSGSNGALHGLTMYHMDDAPINEFFLEYIARPQTAEMFYEDVLMAIVFYGMPILAENNKPRLLYHLKNRGYRGYSMNRPDKPANKLSVTEKELGGIPNSSEDVKIAHASAIHSYIEKHMVRKDAEDMVTMPFNRTLHDWSKFDISNRTKFDASISSGLAIMACQKHLYQPNVKKSKISINFARYDNSGSRSKLIKDER